MADDQKDIIKIKKNLDDIKKSLSERIRKGKKEKYKRFVLSALGSIPWVGGFISGIGSLRSEKDQNQINELQQQWLEEYKNQLYDLVQALEDICTRFDELGEQIEERIQSPEYLSLVKKSFR